MVSRGNLDHQLFNPLGLSVENDGNIVIADSRVKLIKIFSPRGHHLSKLSREGSLPFPFLCIQYDKYLIVSDQNEHCNKVFDRNGNFLYKFGKKGKWDGELSRARCLTVNKAGHLMARDASNHSV